MTGSVVFYEQTAYNPFVYDYNHHWPLRCINPHREMDLHLTIKTTEKKAVFFLRFFLTALLVPP